jgi:general secretion pathway protein G
VIVIVIVAILAEILAPMIFSQIDEAKISRATADSKSISSAVLTFRKDIGVWPTLSGVCNANTTLLVGEGTTPQGLAAMAYTSTATINLKNVLTADNEEYYNSSLYKGPYMSIVTAAPWGNAYIIAADQFAIDGRAAFILSAGPNGTIETPVFSISTLGDDIGIRIK